MAEEKTKISKTKTWFLENVVEDKEDIITIAKLANRVIYEKLSIELFNEETTIAMYAKIFEAICEEIISKQETHPEYSLNIADRFRIGYTTTSTDDDEKEGNFMVFIQHIDGKATDIVSNDDGDEDDEQATSLELCAQWITTNIYQAGNEDMDILKEIAPKAKKKLSEIINLKIESHEFVLPVFCIIHSQILNYIRLKRVEDNSVSKEINIAGLYTIGIEETDDAEERIYYIPSVSLKRMFKNDEVATGRNE